MTNNENESLEVQCGKLINLLKSMEFGDFKVIVQDEIINSEADEFQQIATLLKSVLFSDNGRRPNYPLLRKISKYGYRIFPIKQLSPHEWVDVGIETKIGTIQVKDVCVKKLKKINKPSTVQIQGALERSFAPLKCLYTGKYGLIHQSLKAGYFLIENIQTHIVYAIQINDIEWVEV